MSEPEIAFEAVISEREDGFYYSPSSEDELGPDSVWIGPFPSHDTAAQHFADQVSDDVGKQVLKLLGLK